MFFIIQYTYHKYRWFYPVIFSIKSSPAISLLTKYVPVLHRWYANQYTCIKNIMCFFLSLKIFNKRVIDIHVVICSKKRDSLSSRRDQTRASHSFDPDRESGFLDLLIILITYYAIYFMLKLIRYKCHISDCDVNYYVIYFLLKIVASIITSYKDWLRRGYFLIVIIHMQICVLSYKVA